MNNQFHQLTQSLPQSATRCGALKKFGLGLAGIAIIAGALCVTGFGQKYYRLNGAWVGGRPGFLYSAVLIPMDPLAQSCAVRGILKNFDAQFAGLLVAFGADNLSDAVGEARLISADTAQWTLLAHAQATPHQSGDLLQTRAIIMFSGTWTYTSQTSVVLNYTVKVYPASADADADGYPDANAQPVLSIPGVVDNVKRVPIL